MEVNIEETPKVVQIMAMFDSRYVAVGVLENQTRICGKKKPLLAGSERKLKVRTDSLCSNEVYASTHPEDCAEPREWH